MSKQSKRRSRAKRAAQVKAQPHPLFTTPIVEMSEDVPEGTLSVKQAAFLAAYAACGFIGKAAIAAGCCRTTHSIKWMKQPFYVQKFAGAQAAANELLEVEARRRAVDGVIKLKFYKDKDTGEALPVIDPRTRQPYVEYEYSDTLLTLLLKAHMHEKYAERQKVENTGSMTILDPAIQAALIEFETEEVPANPPIDESDAETTAP
jgi:hypothetical protein